MDTRFKASKPPKAGYDRLRHSVLPTIEGHAKGLADGLQGHLEDRWEIRLEGILEGLRHIEKLATVTSEPIETTSAEQHQAAFGRSRR